MKKTGLRFRRLSGEKRLKISSQITEFIDEVARAGVNDVLPLHATKQERKSEFLRRLSL